MSDARLLADALADPARVARLDTACWTALLTIARAELLAGALADRLAGLDLPAEVRPWLEDARDAAAASRRSALWEAEMARRALAGLAGPVVLLKGTAYHAAGLAAGTGRHVGDLDLLVSRDQLAAAETALLADGWEWVKADAYDDAYYRRWMHELPPLIHRERDRMADLHHTILPPTARIAPDAAALVAAAVPLGKGLSVLSPEDMVIHAALHLFADGDLAGGLRNLWDIDRLLREFDGDGWWAVLGDRAARHGALAPVERALRLAHHLYGTPVPPPWRMLQADDRPFRRRLLARDGWGRATRPLTRAAFYARSHWQRMPPRLLARHLWIKWRRR